MNYTLFLQTFREKYAGIQDKTALFHYLREELQYLILQFLFTKTTYPLYFMGGTFLRLSYKINRFSEDIDLALDKPDQHFPGEELFSRLESFFSHQNTGFSAKTNWNLNRNVLKMTVSFAQILHDLGISPLPNETIKIKIEIDTNPPSHASYESKRYSSFFGDYLSNTFDLNTGFAGKIGAILFREYQKGRDYYDLLWYLQRIPSLSINLSYLNENCLQQQKRTFGNASEVFEEVTQKVQKLDVELLKKDLGRFIMMDKPSFERFADEYVKTTTALLENHLSSKP